MREVVKFGLLLALVCAVSAGTLSAVFSKVDPLIKENERLEAIKKRKAVLPEAVTFAAVEKDERTVYAGLDGSGEWVGTAMTVSRRGYAGPIRMTVGVGPDGLLTGLAISKLDQSETPGLGVKITYPEFLDKFRGLTLDQVRLTSDGGSIDAITAATISTRAVVDGIQNGMKWYFDTFPEGPAGYVAGEGDAPAEGEEAEGGQE